MTFYNFQIQVVAVCVLLHNQQIEWDDATPVEPLRRSTNRMRTRMRRLVQGEEPVEALIGRPFAKSMIQMKLLRIEIGSDDRDVY